MSADTHTLLFVLGPVGDGDLGGPDLLPAVLLGRVVPRVDGGGLVDEVEASLLVHVDPVAHVIPVLSAAQ